MNTLKKISKTIRSALGLGVGTVICASIFVSGCTISGQQGNGRDFSIVEMINLTDTWQKEFNSNEKKVNNEPKSKRSLECVARNITRNIHGAYAGLRTEWGVVLTRDCRINLALLDTGFLVSSNCVPQILDFDQDQIAYLVSHAFAHSMLEHDNVRASEMLKDIDVRAEDFNFKKILRNGTGYSDFGQVLGLIDEKGNGKPYTEEQEVQAEKVALLAMANAGFNPSASLIVHQKLKSNPDLRGIEYIKMHPHSDVFMENLSSVLIPEVQKLYKKSREEYHRKPQCQF